MPTREILYQGNISIRNLPINFNESDREIFGSSLKSTIPATMLLQLDDISVNSDSILFRGCTVLPESFPPSPDVLDAWTGSIPNIKFILKECIFRRYENIDRKTFWITDEWSKAYFHWMTDALPRLFAIKK